jgi:DNA-binding CsgD family transcriptional regulator
MCEVKVLAAAARSVAAAADGNLTGAAKLLPVAEKLGVWDPVVCALRSSTALADMLLGIPKAQAKLETLFVLSNDLGLARRAGFRTRNTRQPDQLLSPREFEVLGLLARGLRNAEIARALFISPSTTKVHVRHVYEKLGVRSRTQAAARFERFNQAD